MTNIRETRTKKLVGEADVVEAPMQLVDTQHEIRTCALADTHANLLPSLAACIAALVIHILL